MKKGPIPEGTWSLKQEEHQRYEDERAWVKPFSDFGAGLWPGGTDSWGENRVWISGPDGEKNPNKLGRNGFSVHGGAEPGSAGCIDATEFMADFTAYFKQTGKDLPLIVSYPD